MTPRMIGGEMTVWSDLDGKHGRGPVRSAVLRPLLGAVSGRTLVAGPHRPEFLEFLSSSPVAWLARGVPDAEFLAATFADRPDATVLCGSLDKLAAAPVYDTVVALDGLGRLRSAEDDVAGVSWADDLARLVSVLRPGGRLLLGVENLGGLHRVVTLPAEPTDGDWGDAAGEFDPSRPASPSLLRAALAELGLSVRASYAAFPSPVAPSVLVEPSLLADRSVRGWATATIRSAFEAGATFPAAAVRGRSACDGGLPAAGADDGSGRSAAAKPSGATLADPARIAAGALRAGIGAELACGWFVVAEGGEADRTMPALPVAVLGDGTEIAAADDLPTGRTLDELLLAASLRRDQPGLRELLGGWQHGEHAGVPADRIVVGPDGGHTPMAPAGRSETALARLAATMIREGHAYLWPAPADPAELTALLAAMAGRQLAETPADAEPAVPSVRELLMERDRLARELGEARAKHGWYEGMLLSREAELKRVRRVNAVLLATMPGRAATALSGRLRAARRALRKLIT